MTLNLSAETDSVNREDFEMVARLREGDDAAYEEIVGQYAGRMLATARRFLTNDEDALDAVQEAFVSAFKAIDRFDGRAKLGTWLFRITVNASLARLRSRRRNAECSIEDLLPRFQADGHQTRPAAGWSESADRLLEREELRCAVRMCIDSLPADYREIVILRDLEEYDTETVSRLLQVSTSVVKTRLHRARQALRTLLDPYVMGGTA